MPKIPKNDLFIRVVLLYYPYQTPILPPLYCIILTFKGFWYVDIASTITL